jgi:hypothetical protein
MLAATMQVKSDGRSDGSFLPDVSFASASVSNDELRDSIDDAAEIAEMDKWFEPSHGNPEPPSTYFQQPEPALPLPEGPTFTVPIELCYEDLQLGDVAVDLPSPDNDDIPSLSSDSSFPSLLSCSSDTDASADGEDGGNDDGEEPPDHLQSNQPLRSRTRGQQL